MVPLLLARLAAAAPPAEIHDVLRHAAVAASAITDEGLRVHATIRVAGWQARTGDPVTARATVRPVAQAAPVGASRVSDLVDLATAQAESGDRAGASRTLQHALSVASSMRDDVGTVAVIARALAQAGDVKAALQAAGDAAIPLARIAVVQADAGDAAGAQATAARALRATAARAEDFDKTVEVAEVARALALAGDRRGAARGFQHAVRLAAEGPDPRLAGKVPVAAEARVGRLLWVARVQLQAGESAAAGATLKRALALAGGADGDEGKPRQLVAIAGAFVEAGDRGAAARLLADARQALEQVPRPNDRAYLLIEIAGVEARAGEPAAAVRTLAAIWDTLAEPLLVQVEERAAQIPDARLRADLTVAVAGARAELAARGGPGTAGRRPTDGLRLLFHHAPTELARIAQILHKAGDRPGAEATFRQAVTAATTPWPLMGGPDPLALELVARLQAEGGDWRGALGWALTMHDPRARTYALLGVAAGMLAPSDRGSPPIKPTRP